MISYPDDVLQGDHFAFHAAEHFGDVVTLRDPSRKRDACTMTSTEPVIISRVSSRGAKPPHRDRRTQDDWWLRAAGWRVAFPSGVVASIHGLQQVEASAPRTSPTMMRSGRIRKLILDEIAHLDLAFAFKVRRTRFKTHNVRLLQLKFGGVFAGDDAFFVIDGAGQAVEKGCLARTCAARDQRIAANTADDLENRRGLRRDGAELDEIFKLQTVFFGYEW